MIFFPNAKINLGLSILDKRADGYHNIESVMYPIALADVAEFITLSDTAPSDNTSCHCYGYALDMGTENLCIKAYNLLRSDFDLPAISVSICKHIPIGAGLGGGSSDGSYMLKALNEHFMLGISDHDLATYALSIGSDCPFFISNQPALATGRGEILTPLDPFLKGYYLLLIYTGDRINTGKAYAFFSTHIRRHSAVNQGEKNLPGQIIRSPVDEWRDRLGNDFENYAFGQYPVLRKIKESLYAQGAVYASMTGSGSAIYGIFREEAEPVPAWKDYYIWTGEL